MSEIVNGVEVTSLAKFYAYCIIDGMGTFKGTPKVLKEDVAVVLISLGLEDLVTSESYKAKAQARIDAANKIDEEEEAQA